VIWVGLFLPLALALACSPTPGPAPIPPVDPVEPIPVVDNACMRAEEKLRELKCERPGGQPWAETKAGTPFHEACERAAADGRDWHPDCIAAILSCDEVDLAYTGEMCE
jgi:hypothetical protein